MRIQLSDGGKLDLSESDARTLYSTLLERARQRGASSAARKLRPAIIWSSGPETRVTLDQFETAAVEAACRDSKGAP
jgi:hypothetical protein